MLALFQVLDIVGTKNSSFPPLFLFGWPNKSTGGRLTREDLIKSLTHGSPTYMRESETLHTREAQR